MAIITGTAALVTAGKLILKAIAKHGLKKAVKAAVKQGVKKVAKSVTKKSVKQFAKRKAKDFAKDKARDFLRGRKRGKKETQEIQKERGRDLIVRDRDSSAAVKFIGGESAKVDGKGALVAPAKGSKISYGEITQKIDNIVELTGSIDAIVKSQYKQKKDEAKQLRKDRENERKSMREALLEQKKTGKQTGSGTISGKKGKGFNPLKFLAMVLIGTIVVGLVNAIQTLMNIMKTLGLNLHQVWVIVKYVPQVLGKVFKNALKFIKTTGGKFLKGIQSKFGKLFGGAKDKVIKGFKAIATGIKNFASGLWKTIKNAATALLKGLAKGPKMIANLIKNLPGLKTVAQGAKNIMGGVKKVGGKVVSKVKNVVGKSIKAVTSSKVFKNLQGGVSKVKNLAIKGFKSVKNLATKGFKSIKGLATKGLTKLKGIAKTLGKTLKSTASKVALSAKKALSSAPKVAGKMLKGARAGAKNVLSSGAKVAGKILKGTVAGKAAVGGAKVAGKILKGAGAAAKKVLASGAKVAGKAAGKVGASAGGKAAGGFVGKLFPKLKGLIGKAKPLFKNLAKAAKGIKIPIIGPVIVIATSLMAQEPLDRALFKGIGTALGGMIGLALGPLGALVGELLGEAGGDLLYVAIKQGPAAAAKELKSKFINFLKTGLKIKDFVVGGFRRFFTGFMEKHSFELPWWVSGPIKKLTGMELGKIPNILQLMNPFKMLPLLKDSFFPPGGEKSEGGNGAQLGSSGGGDKAEGVDQSASYEEGADEEILVPFPGDTGGGGSAAPLVISRKTISLGSNTRSAIDTMQKEKHLAALY